MIVLAGVFGGAIRGGLLAKRRGGKRLDILQYAVGHAIAFGLLGFFVTIAMARLFG
ncbi:hypothetical protein [Tranquillimonas alkanivorans]|uniref:Uncharacterized protein n=1 Tax=Tranquillimonas alkanivorans TaxID=441119 RepID=A0A1I5WWM2_9RHOB|nr:hypothetical protein [Tranquillimonas alkanivorans]SFQ24142.1 hypothetical protein SAMN04488047_1624 [Tranquillimonas alkanivorans]